MAPNELASTYLKHSSNQAVPFQAQSKSKRNKSILPSILLSQQQSGSIKLLVVVWTMVAVDGLYIDVVAVVVYPITYFSNVRYVHNVF